LTVNSFELQINAALEQSLAMGISRLRQLTEVNLASSGLTAAGCELLAKGLSKSKMLVTLILDMNTIGDMGLGALCEHVLVTLPSLRLLSIKANGIGPEGCATLRNALEQGCALYQLDLKGNDIGCEEVDKLIIGDKSQVGAALGVGLRILLVFW
jgi:regulator of ribosome biosynthesis